MRLRMVFTKPPRHSPRRARAVKPETFSTRKQPFPMREGLMKIHYKAAKSRSTTTVFGATQHLTGHSHLLSHQIASFTSRSNGYRIANVGGDVKGGKPFQYKTHNVNDKSLFIEALFHSLALFIVLCYASNSLLIILY